ncbi:MAG: flagellar export protein FliJ [Deltaproteobacteria bacterium]|nr:MAG: flagellar export protein FliJ [Deltaproteobacteria bacterium]
MKRFHFSLETLLKYRHHLEQQALQAVSAAQADVTACERRIQEIESEIRIALNEVAIASETGISAHRYQLFSSFISGLEETLAGENARLDNLKSLLARKQESLRKRSVEKKSMEKLKDTRKAHYYQTLAKLEQKETDERVVLKKSREVRAG